MVLLEFDSGTLLVSGPDNELSSVRQWLTYDERVDRYRTAALNYATIVLALRHAGMQIKDEAKALARSPGSRSRNSSRGRIRRMPCGTGWRQAGAAWW